jgi:hypothetical protein
VSALDKIRHLLADADTHLDQAARETANGIQEVADQHRHDAVLLWELADWTASKDKPAVVHPEYGNGVVLGVDTATGLLRATFGRRPFLEGVAVDDVTEAEQ